MARLWVDNKRLMQEQENIMKTLCDRQNQQHPNLSLKHKHMIEEQEYRTKYLEMKGGEENQVEKSRHASKHKTQKR